MRASIKASDPFSFYFGANLTGKTGDVASVSTPYSLVERNLYAGARIARQAAPTL